MFHDQLRSHNTHNMDFGEFRFTVPPTNIKAIWERPNPSGKPMLLSPWTHPWCPPPPGSEFAPYPRKIDPNPFKSITNRYCLPRIVQM